MFGLNISAYTFFLQVNINTNLFQVQGHQYSQLSEHRMLLSTDCIIFSPDYLASSACTGISEL
jgi:hypothetical protein